MYLLQFPKWIFWSTAELTSCKACFNAGRDVFWQSW